MDYHKLTVNESCGYRDLCEMAERFSDDEEELKIPKLYYCEKELRVKPKI